MAAAPPVLIAGAGPTGLVLALVLSRLGVPFRLIDKADGPGTASRALVVHARTLEYYAMLGFADRALAAGVPIEGLRFREDGKDIAHLAFANIGAGLSAFPTVLSLAQDRHEELLVAELARRGHQVERRTSLQALQQDDTGVDVTLQTPGGPETSRFQWVAGTDGASSQVRHSLGIGFPGGTYEQRFYVADVDLPGMPVGQGYISFGADSFLLTLPARRDGSWRLVGVVPKALTDKKDIGFEEVLPEVRNLLGLAPTAVNWFSVYHVHHRVADNFRKGRVFLAGDAGHVHSPAGGQGMNTGIGDTVNLGWKLAEVVQGRAAPALLDSYEIERIRFARTLVATTDAAFTRIVDPALTGRFMRTVLAPALLPFATRFTAVRRAIFRTVSQIRIAYPESPLSHGRAGAIIAGSRLPYLPASYAPLADWCWQLHVHGVATGALRKQADELGLPLHVFAFTPEAQAAGYARDAVYLMRPDGYVAIASTAQDLSGVRALQQMFSLSFSLPVPK